MKPLIPKWVLILAGGLLFLGPAAEAQHFTKIYQFSLTGVVPYTQAFGDYDGDGNMDLVCSDLVGVNTWETRLFRNNGAGSFTRVTLPPTQHSYGSTHVFWGDDNGDGRLDMLITGSDESSQPVMRILYGQPDGTFVDSGVRLPGEPLLWADLDNDGKLDIIAGNQYSNGFAQVYWKETGTNYTPRSLGLKGYLSFAAAADVDNDGDLDVLLSGFGVPVGGVVLLRNDGGRRLVDTGLTFPGSGVWVDVDGDGKLDLVLGGQGPASSIVPKVYRNQGNWQFVDLSPDLTPGGGTMRWADFNQDGSPDFLVNGWWSSDLQDPRPRLFFNNGAGVFTQSPLLLPAFEGGPAEVADLEGDGDVDFLIGGSEWNSNPYVRLIYRNDRVQTGTAPQSPTNLAAVVVGSRIFLSWAGANAPGMATFNLRVGTQPGQGDVLSSLSRTDGRRLVPGMGNTQTSPHWYLAGLPPGTYYWSVQAVDWSLRPSAFAPEATFVVVSNTPAPPPPTISELPDVFTDEEVTADPVTFSIGPESSLPYLEVTVEADDPALVPASGIVLAGEGTNRSLTITPGTNQFGTSLITVRVTDAAGQSASSSFLLTVNHVNHPPVLQPIPNQVVYQNAGSITVPFVVYDAETQPFGLKFRVASSNPSLIPTNAIRILGFQQPSLQITPLTNQVGFAVLTLTASDGLAETSVAFAVTVLPSPFLPGTSRFANYQQGQAVLADFDSDGHLDFLVLGDSATTSPEIRYYRNNGFGGFVDSGLSIPNQAVNIAAVGDFNADGYPDVLLMGGNGAQWLWNQHGTNFSLGAAGSPVAFYSSVAVGDLNNDGTLDLIADTGNNAMKAFLNSNGVFRAVGQILPPISSSKALGDFDGDGLLDFAFSGTRSDNTVTNGVLLGLGGGTFGPSQVVLDQTGYGPLGWCDIDGDGQLDLWQLQLTLPPRRLLIYRNLGGGHLAQPVAVPVDFTDPSRIRWADFDGDGKLDFMLQASSPATNGIPGVFLPGTYLTIYRNDGDFHFTSLGAVFGNVQPWFLAVGDVDNDGAIDVSASAVSGPFLSSVSPTILLNRLSGPNTPPNAPVGLAAQVNGDSVWLSWQPSADFDQSVPLTYNVRVGTRPGLGDVVPPMSVTSGSREVVGPGNAGLRTNLFLTNIVGETFYWTVQAVDNSYMGGPFAQEGHFLIDLPGNQPPVIGPIADQAINEDTQLKVSFTLSDDRTPVDNLRMHVIPGDPYLVPVANMSFNGTGTNRMLTLLPGTNQFGQTTITIEATDAAGLSATRTFGLIVSNVNDPPWISSIPDQPFAYSPEPVLVPFTIYDVDNSPDQLQLEAVSSNPAIVAPTNIMLTGTGTNWLATIRANGPIEGQTTITITVTDPVGASDTTQFLVSFHNQVFRQLSNALGGVRLGSIAWGDIDNDGYLDLAIAGQGINQTAIYHNDGHGNFLKLNTDFPPVDGGGVAWEDFDKDGRLDLLLHGRDLTGADGYIFRVYRNLGNGQFALFQSLNGLYGPAAWGDYDNDGWPDIISTGQDTNGQNFSVLYHNEGGQSFRPVATFSNILANAQLALPGLNSPWIDLNQDGNLDLLLQQYDPLVFGGWKDLLLLGDGAGHFTNAPVPWSGTLVAWADFDNDGLPDVLESVYTRSDLRVLRNTGSNSFLPWGNSLQSNWTPDSVAVGDFNNDGFLDVLSFGYEGAFNYQTHLFANGGDGTWQEVASPLLDYTFGTGAWADIDNDGDVDIVLDGQRDQQPDYGYTTFIYRNDQLRSNSPPTAPTGLRALYTSNAVFLTWQPATDAEQTNGLTYNVRLGTTPGGIDAVSPLADALGRRLVPRPGNAGWLTRKILTGLQRSQNYYWSVQAIDNCYAGSPFADETNFVIGAPPVLAPIPAQTMPQDSQLRVPIRFTDPLGTQAGALVRATSSDPILAGAGALSVIGSGTNWLLTISPAPSQYGPATIVVTVIDAQGGLAEQSFPLSVSRVTPPVLSVRLLSDGTPFLAASVEPYATFVVETSTNLTTWQVVGEYSTPDGLIEFIGLPTPAGTPRFYRVRTP